MPEAIIKYHGQTAKVNCDGRCDKAWGRSQRPATPGGTYYLADSELGSAPANPGTIEGTDIKPPDATFFPNCWCVRECERCDMSAPGKYNEPLPVKLFDSRVFNNAKGHAP